MPSKEFMKDALERILFAALYAAVSVAIVTMADLHYVWAPVLTVALNMVKVMIAQKVGDPNTASLTK